MGTNNINILWKSFKGIRKLNTINSDTVLGADIAHNVVLSKEKSGQERSIKSAGWFEPFATLTEDVIRLFSANISGYSAPDQLIAFTKTSDAINAWIVTDSTLTVAPLQIATFSLQTSPYVPVADVTDVCMIQFGDHMAVAVAFGTSTIGFITYSATAIPGWNQMGTTGFYYVEKPITEATTSFPVTGITRVCPYRSRLAINGATAYNAQHAETINGVWFSEAGNPINFSADYITSASETSAFFVETGEYVNQLEEYHGLTVFCRNRSYNITGTSQNDIRVLPLVAKGVFGNATFVIDGKCGYVDSWNHNMFLLQDNIDGTIGFDTQVGNDIQEYLQDVKDVSISVVGTRVRMLKPSGQSLVYDADINEWVEESFTAGARAVTFLNKEYFCDGTTDVYLIQDNFGAHSEQTPNENGYYSHYRTNLIWLDSQSSVKSHIYPFAIILEPQTNNDFFVKFTTDRGNVYEGRITKGGFANVATYSNSDAVPEDGSQFVADDDDLSGRVFFNISGTELLVTVERPPFWRYLQIDIYTTSPTQQFNISGIEAKNTFVETSMLDY